MLCAHHVTHATSPPHTAYHGVLCAQHVCSTHSTARMLHAQHNHACCAHSTYAMPPPPVIHATHVATHPAPLIHTQPLDSHRTAQPHVLCVQHPHPRALRTAQSRNLRRTPCHACYVAHTVTHATHRPLIHTVIHTHTATQTTTTRARANDNTHTTHCTALHCCRKKFPIFRHSIHKFGAHNPNFLHDHFSPHFFDPQISGATRLVLSKPLGTTL